MRKFLFVLVMSAFVGFAGYAEAANGYVNRSRSGSSSRSRSAASARSPTPYDYISRAYMIQYIEKNVGRGYAVPAMQSVDSNYRASSSYSQSRGPAVLIVPGAYIGSSGIKFSAPFAAGSR